MGLIDRFVEQAKRAKKRIVFPEGEDERIVQAAQRLASDGIADPIVITSPKDLPAGITSVDPAQDPSLSGYCEAYAERRGAV